MVLGKSFSPYEFPPCYGMNIVTGILPESLLLRIFLDEYTYPHSLSELAFLPKFVIIMKIQVSFWHPIYKQQIHSTYFLKILRKSETLLEEQFLVNQLKLSRAARNQNYIYCILKDNSLCC